MAKKKIDDGHVVKSMTRMGSHDFIVEHENGHAFECKIDDPAKFNTFKGLKNNSPRITGFAGVGEKKALICGVCNQQVYKVTYKDGKYFCIKCI